MKMTFVSLIPDRYIFFNLIHFKKLLENPITSFSLKTHAFKSQVIYLTVHLLKNI